MAGFDDYLIFVFEWVLFITTIQIVFLIFVELNNK